MSTTVSPYSRLFTIGLAAALSLAVGCQEVEHPSPMLTEKQWNKVKDHLYAPDEAPEPDYEIGANYDDKIEFIGFSIGKKGDKKQKLRAGEEVEIRWYWRAKQDLEKDWKIFVHLDSKNTDVEAAQRRQNLDHEAMDGLFPTSKWKTGKVVEDIQTVRIRSDYPTGQAIPYVGLYRGDKRLPIKNEVPKTKDRRVKAPTLEVVSGGGSGADESESSDRGGDDKPSYKLTTFEDDDEVSVEIDGELDEKVWSSLDPLTLEPFGGGADKKTKVHSFIEDDKLYVGAKLEDEHVWSEKKERDSNTWEEEVFEMFVDVDGDGENYLELQVNPLGTIFDARFKKRLGTGKGERNEQIDRAKKFTLDGLESAVGVDGTVNNKSDEDESWSVELSIPLESLPGVDNADDMSDAWAVNFYRYDRPADGGTLTYGWNTAPRNDFHRVSKFGRFELTSDAEDVREALDPEMLKQLRKGNRAIPKPGKAAQPKKK